MKWTFLLVLNAVCAFANTEIVNFAASPVQDPQLHFQHEWPILSPEYASLLWDLDSNPTSSKSNVNQEPCQSVFHWTPTEHPSDCLKELWVALDLDSPEWAKYSKFTLRLSWPASHPVDAYLKIYDPSDLAELPRPGPPRRSRHRAPPTETRSKYARVQLISTAVWNPELLRSNQTIVSDLTTVPIILTLEPLLFGVLPESIVPTLFALVIAAIVGFFIARTVNEYLQDITQPPPPKEEKTE
ncbi:hypothetical protein CC2G_000279 [Coprinopsis cinerea AmutBmut pab1-1]|nr:hypothetical protein CC2G_000279 [Coprinopsis cinerea AmutBmut pab1-1]